jgi:poly-gamma-glutamate capsule biosynthesis protein CapA/YwtB (metallophosphatase superfamily)
LEQEAKESTMDDQINLLVETGINLTALAVKGTVSAVTTKIKALKTEKDLETVKNKYDELINEILSEREEAVRNYTKVKLIEWK